MCSILAQGPERPTRGQKVFRVSRRSRLIVPRWTKGPVSELANPTNSDSCQALDREQSQQNRPNALGMLPTRHLTADNLKFRRAFSTLSRGMNTDDSGCCQWPLPHAATQQDMLCPRGALIPDCRPLMIV